MTTERTFDWIPKHDPRSLDYPIRAALPRTVEERPKTWRTGVVLDQGSEGSCVGHGWVAELLASPKPAKTDPLTGHLKAVHIYREAQLVDEWEGEAYDGTSVLAGAKVVQSEGAMEHYRWAFSVEDIRDAVITEGPVVIGIPWYSSMYYTRPSGLVDVGGNVVGGHCLTITGYHPGMRIRGEGWHERHRVFRWRNSWGESYGLKGDGLIRYEDLRDLLRDQGEACVPINRQKVSL